jgi:hypothetical protein
MAVALQPLFGLTCVGEAMPPGADPECAAALAEAAPLRAAVERAPSPAERQDYTDGLRPPGPDAVPDYDPSPGFSPSGRR